MKQVLEMHKYNSKLIFFLLMYFVISGCVSQSKISDANLKIAAVESQLEKAENERDYYKRQLYELSEKNDVVKKYKLTFGIVQVVIAEK